MINKAIKLCIDMHVIDNGNTHTILQFHAPIRIFNVGRWDQINCQCTFMSYKLSNGI